MTLRDHLGPRTPENAALHDELDRLLAARAVALEEAATYLKEAADDWRSTGNELPAQKIEDEISGVVALATTDSTAALDRVIRAHVEKALEMAGKVKPLEWVDGEISDRWPRLTAASPFGTYEALQWSSGDYGWSAPHPDPEDHNIEYGGLTSLEAAQDAAQNDCQQRTDAMRKVTTADDVLREMGGRGNG